MGVCASRKGVKVGHDIATHGQDVLDKRIMKANDDRHQLVVLMVHTSKLELQSRYLKGINEKLLKDADSAVHGKISYTRKVKVGKREAAAKKAEIERLHEAQKMLEQCASAIRPAQDQLRKCLEQYEFGMRELELEIEASSRGSSAIRQLTSSGPAERTMVEDFVEPADEGDTDRSNEVATLPQAVEAYPANNEMERSNSSGIHIHVHPGRASTEDRGDHIDDRDLLTEKC